jgi:hypothetical protein
LKSRKLKNRENNCSVKTILSLVSWRNKNSIEVDNLNARGSSNFFIKMTDFEHGSVPMLILVDESGTSFIVMNSPSTFEGPRFSGYEAQKNEVISAPILRRCCTPLNQEENHAEECFIKNEDDHREDDDREIDTREDEAVLEEAIFNRKSQLEKQAEERAEGVFRLWYKENKSLEQAIDESLRCL